jgi:hypothetical protein
MPHHVVCLGYDIADNHDTNTVTNKDECARADYPHACCTHELREGYSASIGNYSYTYCGSNNWMALLPVLPPVVDVADLGLDPLEHY